MWVLTTKNKDPTFSKIKSHDVGLNCTSLRMCPKQSILQLVT